MASLPKRIRGRAQEITSSASSPEGRRRLGRRYSFEALRKVAPIVGVETPQGIVFVSTRDRTVGRHVFVDGGWDTEGLPNALEVAARFGCAGLAGKVFVEVGGNIGTTTMQAARLAKSCIVLEPEARNLALLRANLAANMLSDNVEVIAAAASREAGMAALELSAVNDGDHRVAAEGKGEVSITTVTLDRVLAERGISSGDIGLLWLDTQGHEAQVLSGSARLLESPPFTVTEYWPPQLRARGDLDLFESLTDAWSGVIDLRSTSMKPEPIADIRARHLDNDTDLLLIP